MKKIDTNIYDKYFIDYYNIDIYDLSYAQENESPYGLWNKVNRKIILTEITIYLENKGKTKKYSKKVNIDFDKVKSILIGNLGVNLLIDKTDRNKFYLESKDFLW